MTNDLDHIALFECQTCGVVKRIALPEKIDVLEMDESCRCTRFVRWERDSEWYVNIDKK